jgi:hypothetical protein
LAIIEIEESIAQDIRVNDPAIKHDIGFRSEIHLMPRSESCNTIIVIFYFLFLFDRRSLHASITTAVDVVSLSNAYCFICLTRDFGKSHVVLTLASSLLFIRICHLIRNICITLYTDIQ